MTFKNICAKIFFVVITMDINGKMVNNQKKKILDLFIDNYLKTNDTDHILGMILCGSFKNDDNDVFSDIDIQIIMDETFSNNSNVNKNGGNIVRGVEMINNYRFEYFTRNIQGYYYEANEAYKQQKNALLTIIGHGQIFFYTDEESLWKIRELQKFILELYSNPFPVLDNKEITNQLFSIYNDINLLLEIYKVNPYEFTMNYFLILEKIRKFYSRSTGCCYLPPAKVWKIYHNKEYAERFCKSKIPDDEFLLAFTKCILCDSNGIIRIEHLRELVNLCKIKLNVGNLSNLDYLGYEEELDNILLDKDEILELIMILENRRLKLNEKYFNNEKDFEYFYFIVLQMINRFCLKINNSINVINEHYQNLYNLAKIAVDSTEKYRIINILLDEIKENCEKEYTEKINPMHYKVLVKPTTWNSNKQSRF